MMQNFGYPFFCSNNDLQAPRDADVQALNTDKHIQILFKPMSVNEMDIHHWVCSYYNGHQIFIFDTLSAIKTGHINYELVLGNLFPSYFEIGGSIEYPQVQLQKPGSLDCGVYAIANAVALHFGLNSEHLVYDSVDKLRLHLANIFFPAKRKAEQCMEFKNIKRQVICANFQTENAEKVRQDKELKNKKRREAYAKFKAENLEKLQQQNALRNQEEREAYAKFKLENDEKLQQQQALKNKKKTNDLCKVETQKRRKTSTAAGAQK